MSYRDASDSLLQKNELLERELAETKAALRRLRGGDGEPAARTLRSTLRHLLLGARRHDAVVRFAGSLDDQTVSRMLDVLARRFDAPGDFVRLSNRVS